MSTAASLGAGRLLDELEAYGVLDRLGVPRAPSVALDIDAAPPSLPFAYPVVVKVLAAEISHKSDVGGVALGITDAAALAAAMAAMHARLPQAKRVLVQPMIPGVGEVLIGYRVDPDAGPLVMLAAGGIYHRNLSRPQPAPGASRSRDCPRDDCGSARAQGPCGLSRQARGRSRCAGAGRGGAVPTGLRPDSVIEAEVNPLIVRTDGVVAVDAVVRLV